MPDYEHDEEKDEIGGGPAQEAPDVINVEHGLMTQKAARKSNA
jgi:hypothetical protein